MQKDHMKWSVVFVVLSGMCILTGCDDSSRNKLALSVTSFEMVYDGDNMSETGVFRQTSKGIKNGSLSINDLKDKGLVKGVIWSAKEVLDTGHDSTVSIHSGSRHVKLESLLLDRKEGWANFVLSFQEDMDSKCVSSFNINKADKLPIHEYYSTLVSGQWRVIEVKLSRR